MSRPLNPIKIDLLSDTTTRPTPEMLAAMMAAPVGDDVFAEDPTVNALEERVADQFGMESALFCASGTMTNQIAVNVHTRPGDSLVCHELAHIYLYEGGGLMANSGVSVRLTGSPDGLMTAAEVEDAVDTSDNVHNAITKLVAVENTSNRGGGSCFEMNAMHEIAAVARRYDLAYHLDGARVFNAMIARHQDAKDYGRVFDSISVCLSKSLGCPVGSLLLGERDFIREARRVRKRLGGGWRQAGVLAAAGLYALDHHVDRLVEDHAKAALLHTVIAPRDWVKSVREPQTNIVLVETHSEAVAVSVRDQLLEHGIRVQHMGRNRLRMVTHLDVSEADIEVVCERLFHLQPRLSADAADQKLEAGVAY